MSRPATDGPITADALNTEELRAIAFMRSCLPTISTWNDWRAGPSSALMQPVVNAAELTIQHCAWPVAIARHSVNGRPTKPDCLSRRKVCYRERPAITARDGHRALTTKDQ